MATPRVKTTLLKNKFFREFFQSFSEFCYQTFPDVSAIIVRTNWTLNILEHSIQKPSEEQRNDKNHKHETLTKLLLVLPKARKFNKFKLNTSLWWPKWKFTISKRLALQTPPKFLRKLFLKLISPIVTVWFYLLQAVYLICTLSTDISNLFRCFIQSFYRFRSLYLKSLSVFPHQFIALFLYFISFLHFSVVTVWVHLLSQV